MKNIRLNFQYDGSLFHGSQVQKGQRTVQGEIEKALLQLLHQEIRVNFSGRTDAGVHAQYQVLNFKAKTSIPIDRLKYAINHYLPQDINIINSEQVSDNFNARFSAKSRTYRYFIRNFSDLFLNKYSLFYPNKINIKEMNKFGKLFLGKHDFKSFCSCRAEVNNYFCYIYKLSFYQDERNLVVMEIQANRFLHNMVRIILSCFLEINEGNLNDKDIYELFLQRDRTKAPKTISGKGLFLWNIDY